MLNQQKKYDVPLHLILIFVLLVIGIVTSGYLLYAIQKSEFKKRENNNLSVIADMKVREIVNWRKEKLWDAHIVQQNLPATPSQKGWNGTPGGNQCPNSGG